MTQRVLLRWVRRADEQEQAQAQAHGQGRGRAVAALQEPVRLAVEVSLATPAPMAASMSAVGQAPRGLGEMMTCMCSGCGQTMQALGPAGARGACLPRVPLDYKFMNLNLMVVSFRRPMGWLSM